ncbi:MAG TPA: hypothetical protein VFT41_11015, partial [Gemmatimonadaceae bacterium]|nr:hypothetical protein [Gemmatimonadaceae bacterium]
MLEFAPRFDASAAAEIGRVHFGFHGAPTRLVSERDQNFLFAESDAVLKIANAREDVAFLEAQQAVLAHLARRFALTPRVIPALD